MALILIHHPIWTDSFQSAILLIAGKPILQKAIEFLTRSARAQTKQALLTGRNGHEGVELPKGALLSESQCVLDLEKGDRIATKAKLGV